MANKHPITITHHGAKGGTLIANSTPVSHALPSLNEGQIGRLRISIMAASNALTHTNANNNWISTPVPKNTTCAITPGIQAAITVNIKRVTDL